MARDIRPLRTIAAALCGGALGAVVFFLVVGQAVWVLMSDEPDATRGLAGVGAAVVAAGIGAFAGAATALGFAFRRASARERLVTVITVLIAGPPLFALAAITFAQIDDALSLPPVWLAIAVPGTALLGRWLATRTTQS